MASITHTARYPLYHAAMSRPTVLFVSKGESASSTRYRALDYFPLLRSRGWEPRHMTDDKSRTGQRRILSAAADAAVVVVQRRTPAGLYRWGLRRASRRLIFDFDDAIFLPRSGRLSRRPARFRRFVARCDCVWAGNSYLAHEAMRFNSHVLLVPTAIEIERYLPVADKPSAETVLVWIGSRSTRKYLADILPVLEQAGAGGDGIRLKVIADFELTSGVLSIDNLPWSQATEAMELATSSIGIAPMRDDPWTRGKCGLKVLQYMASGLPVITSPCGVNRDLVEAGVTGLHAATAREWIDAIHTLAGDPDRAAAMGAEGRRRCAERFTVDRVFATLLTSLEDTLGGT
jgi:glycosyltransferase involved in cell wall biosynthesis